MGVYIGFIEIKNGNWYNFKPIAEVKKGNIINVLSTEDQEELLPDSSYRNISFAFKWQTEQDTMEKMFAEKSLAVFEFITEELEPNLTAYGERNKKTGYKVPALEMIETGKIRSIDTEGVYYVVRIDEQKSDFYNDMIVEIEVPPYVQEGNKVFLDLNEFWAGPYEVGFREVTGSYYIKPKLKESKYTVNGYNKNEIFIQGLSYSDGGTWNDPDNNWEVLFLKDNITNKQVDVISEEILLEGFKDSLQNDLVGNEQDILNDIPALIEHYDNSVLLGSGLTEDIRRSRLNRLRDILTSTEDLKKTLQTVANSICDLLVKNMDSPNVEEWLQALIEKNPDFLENFKGNKAITAKNEIMRQEHEELKQELEELKQTKVGLEEEIAQKMDAVQTVEEAAIEEKKNELLKVDAEYAELSEKLEELKNKYFVADSIVELNKELDSLKEDINYHEKREKNLRNGNERLEEDFKKIIKDNSDKMVDIAFDGFMSSKMLNAAAEWEEKESEKLHGEFVNKVNSIDVAYKTQEELIDYLFNTIKIVRPLYDKNMIINIAICMTQGFLTVFSGEPGCGKTSICKIFGEVLGLNKIPEATDFRENNDEVKRFVTVSVERGWTSKRDFVGYFNPLSKTFDKSNRRIFDALHQLDTEKQKGFLNLPYIILLDEANLSPMEYYWSDFMHICDDLGPESKINLGEEYVYGIPETLHFLATINNDYTIEKMSPRLIDRAWIITLPRQNISAVSYNTDHIPEEQIEIIGWKALYDAFIPRTGLCTFSADVQKCYDELVKRLNQRRFIVSPRADKAIKCYWSVASKCFEIDELGTEPEFIALDYAVAQRILPKITGNGEDFKTWLVQFKELCGKYGLNMCVDILKDIIERGENQMKYYQFFC